MLLGGGNLNPKNVIVVLINKMNTLHSSRSPTRCIRSYFYKETFINLHYLLWTSFLSEPNIWFYNMYTSRLHYHDLIFGASLLVSHLCSPLPFPKFSGFLSKMLFCRQKSLQLAWNQKLHDFHWFRTCSFGGKGRFIYYASKNIYPLVN